MIINNIKKKKEEVEELRKQLAKAQSSLDEEIRKVEARKKELSNTLLSLADYDFTPDFLENPLFMNNSSSIIYSAFFAGDKNGNYGITVPKITFLTAIQTALQLLPLGQAINFYFNNNLFDNIDTIGINDKLMEHTKNDKLLILFDNALINYLNKPINNLPDNVKMYINNFVDKSMFDESLIKEAGLEGRIYLNNDKVNVKSDVLLKDLITYDSLVFKKLLKKMISPDGIPLSLGGRPLGSFTSNFTDVIKLLEEKYGKEKGEHLAKEIYVTESWINLLAHPVPDNAKDVVSSFEDAFDFEKILLEKFHIVHPFLVQRLCDLEGDIDKLEQELEKPLKYLLSLGKDISWNNPIDFALRKEERAELLITNYVKPNKLDRQWRKWSQYHFSSLNIELEDRYLSHAKEHGFCMRCLAYDVFTQLQLAANEHKAPKSNKSIDNLVKNNAKLLLGPYDFVSKLDVNELESVVNTLVKKDDKVKEHNELIKKLGDYNIHGLNVLNKNHDCAKCEMIRKINDIAYDYKNKINTLKEHLLLRNADDGIIENELGKLLPFLENLEDDRMVYLINLFHYNKISQNLGYDIRPLSSLSGKIMNNDELTKLVKQDYITYKERVIKKGWQKIKSVLDNYANGKIITDYEGLAEKLSELDFIKGNLVKERKGIYVMGKFMDLDEDELQLENKTIKSITITEPGPLLSSILNYYARTKAEEFLKEPTVKYSPSLELKEALKYLKKLEQLLKEGDKSILSQIRNTVIKAFKKLPQYASKESNPYLKEASKKLRGIINGGRYEDIYKSLWEKNPIIFATKEEYESALKNFYSGGKLLSPQEIWGILKYEATKEALKKRKPLIETLSRKGYNYDWNAVRMEIQKIYIGDTYSVSMGNNNNKDKDKEINDYLESLGFASDEEINRIKNDYWIDAIRNVVSPPEQESSTEADDMVITLNDLVYFDRDYDAKQKEEWKNIYSTIDEVKDEEYKAIQDDLINGKPLFKEDILKYIKYEETHDTLYLINKLKKRWARLKCLIK